MRSKKQKHTKKEHKEESRLARMMEPRLWMYFLCLLVFSAVTGWFQFYAGAVELIITMVLFLVYHITTRRRRKEVSQYLATANDDLDAAGNDFMANAPFPMVMLRPDTGEILWSNDRFLRLTDEKEHLFDVKIGSVVPGFDTHWLMEGKKECPETIVIGERKYTVAGHVARAKGRAAENGLVATTYWLDVTDNLAMKEEYYASRPVVGIIVVDNYDEMCRNLNDNARSKIRAAVDEVLEEWAKPAGGLLQRYDRDRYLFIFEERWLTKFQEEKFSLVDTVHKVHSTNGIPASVSIGIGMDTGFEELFQYATLATEMALSRGGDQAVIKNRFNFEFYGGRSQELERRTKVKSRVMANALASLISSASTVYVMGHTFTDFDAIGAAVGIAVMTRKAGIRCRIVIESQENPSTELVKKMKALKEYKDIFILSEDAIIEADSKSLLVVVDTNRPEQVVSQELLFSCTKVAVIDHHRRAASYIENAAMTYHEPNASSACELVTELMQNQLELSDIMREEAEALLAGIVLDTKNFALRTGDRTFEAAAFLRRCGADTVTVKRLFQYDLSDTVAKYDIISAAKLYRDGIMIADLDHAVDRATAARAADELLNVAGAMASFVLFPDADGRVIISGRSIGKVNVQVILEVLGGGGNAAIAGAQVKDSNLPDVLKHLQTAIDKYFEDGK